MYDEAQQALPDYYKVVAHEVRWQLLAALAHSDRRVQELVTAVGQPANLVSYHLRQMRAVHLVSERRSEADKRDVYYTLDVERLRQLHDYAGRLLHPSLGRMASVDSRVYPPTSILFLCTRNSARSQLAEAITRQLTGDPITVMSAGVQPAAVHPRTLSELAARHIDAGQQRAKALEAVLDRHFDYVITVCDRMREVCPTFPAPAASIHWSIPDPVAVPEQEQDSAFARTAREIETRVRHFLINLISGYQPSP